MDAKKIDHFMIRTRAPVAGRILMGVSTCVVFVVWFLPLFGVRGGAFINQGRGSCRRHDAVLGTAARNEVAPAASCLHSDRGGDLRILVGSTFEVAQGMHWVPGEFVTRSTS